jgi:hypothetical protein
MGWGGTIAIAHRALGLLSLKEMLGTTLSDDCAIGARANEAGLRLRTERQLLVPTPLSITLGQAWAFGRRQYQIIRIYRPSLYTLALGCIVLRVAAWVAVAAGGTALLSPLTAGAGMVALGLGSYGGQQVIARRLRLGDDLRVGIGQLVLAAALPLVDIMHASMILGALRRTVQWGHVSYRALEPYNIEVLERRPWQD